MPESGEYDARAGSKDDVLDPLMLGIIGAGQQHGEGPRRNKECDLRASPRCLDEDAPSAEEASNFDTEVLKRQRIKRLQQLGADARTG